MKKHGKLHQEYLDRRSTVRPIKANNKNLKAIVAEEIQKLGYNADLNHIDVFEVTDMSALFKSMSSQALTPEETLRAYFNGEISKWDVVNVKNMEWMFAYSNFNGDISNWQTDSLCDIHHMFHTSNFNKDLSRWNVSNVDNMQDTFKGSSYTGDLSIWNVRKLRTETGLFLAADFTGDLSRWMRIKPELQKHIVNYDDMHSLAKFLKKDIIIATDETIRDIVAEEIQKYDVTANLNHIDVSRVTDMSGLFHQDNSPNRKPINFIGDISRWDVSNVRNMGGMFYRCKFNGNISNWNFSKVKTADGMFKDSSFNQDLTGVAKKYKNLSTLIDSHIDKRKIIAENDSLKDIVTEEIEKYGNNANLNHIDVSRVTDMSGLFENSLFNGDISKWNVAKVKNMDRMFAHTEFNGDISNWNVLNVDTIDNMFHDSKLSQNLSKWQIVIDSVSFTQLKRFGSRNLIESLSY